MVIWFLYLHNLDVEKKALLIRAINSNFGVGGNLNRQYLRAHYCQTNEAIDLYNLSVERSFQDLSNGVFMSILIQSMRNIAK